MLPKKQENIYPATDENILAVIDYYFNNDYQNRDLALRKFKNYDLTLNQIEFILRKLSEAIEVVFIPNEIKELGLKNLTTYGLDALVRGIPLEMSKPRQKITKEFLEFVKITESKNI